MENRERLIYKDGGGNTAAERKLFCFTLKQMGILAVIAALVIGGFMASAKIAFLEASLQNALAEQSPVKITNIRVRDRLVEIGDLSTACYEYESLRTIEDTRKVMGWEIPGTTNTVRLKYCGVVKVGYDVAQIKVDVNEDTQIVLVTLPDPEIKDNYVQLEGLVCSGSNNLLNPIKVEDLPLFFADVIDEALEGAEYHGICESARIRMESLVTEFLAVFPDYTIVFR